jgi:hypothetical protein
VQHVQLVALHVIGIHALSVLKDTDWKEVSAKNAQRITILRVERRTARIARRALTRKVVLRSVRRATRTARRAGVRRTLAANVERDSSRVERAAYLALPARYQLVETPPVFLAWLGPTPPILGIDASPAILERGRRMGRTLVRIVVITAQSVLMPTPVQSVNMIMFYLIRCVLSRWSCWLLRTGLMP